MLIISIDFRVAISRSKDVPPFGPNIPAGAKFGKQKAFADFLLTKGENNLLLITSTTNRILLSVSLGLTLKALMVVNDYMYQQQQQQQQTFFLILNLKLT